MPMRSEVAPVEGDPGPEGVTRAWPAQGRQERAGLRRAGRRRGEGRAGGAPGARSGRLYSLPPAVPAERTWLRAGRAVRRVDPGGQGAPPGSERAAVAEGRRGGRGGLALTGGPGKWPPLRGGCCRPHSGSQGSAGGEESPGRGRRHLGGWKPSGFRATGPLAPLELNGGRSGFLEAGRTVMEPGAPLPPGEQWLLTESFSWSAIPGGRGPGRAGGRRGGPHVHRSQGKRWGAAPGKAPPGDPREAPEEASP